MILLVLAIGFVLFQLYETNREKTARYITTSELKREFASHNSGTEKLM
jgi:hypothetical protein